MNYPETHLPGMMIDEAHEVLKKYSSEYNPTISSNDMLQRFQNQVAYAKEIVALPNDQDTHAGLASVLRLHRFGNSSRATHDTRSALLR